MGNRFFLRGPIEDPNDSKLVAVHVGGDASKPTAPAHATLPNKRFCSKLYAKKIGSQIGSPIGATFGSTFGSLVIEIGSQLGPSTKKLGPNLEPHLGPSMTGSDQRDVMGGGVRLMWDHVVRQEGSRTMASGKCRIRNCADLATKIKEK